MGVPLCPNIIAVKFAGFFPLAVENWNSVDRKLDDNVNLNLCFKTVRLENVE